ncbi:hypothetical protein RRU94_18435 [Domibacillus sp. DTU_2020_1001157_1_SI_ALB_TIR_016]|uniref:hypothetical protein n=1 Tax=Domibacillus sp. DTU_2020_1001157_1_SI_ALB_TIR_016 TaxID=3077789 RepID=UPI0028E1DB14|nr:hypothetical protein [Domibacillus sp. DTU_2020_1001157_1_SI_ALB_TIR_016]WNS79507.1 hypothetical protein RRU94_18435 [Domibacillus sp. DTU_2020_1001157_1_SI_ALB_TIR_016]
MDKIIYKVKLQFDKDNSEIIEVKGPPGKEEVVLKMFTDHEEKWIIDENNQAINLNLVTKISFVKPVSIKGEPVDM